MTITVEHIHPSPGPSGLVQRSAERTLTSLGIPVDWHRFTTGRADAYIFPNPAVGAFLLHDIHSDTKGHGSALMRAINEWADDEKLIGRLVCEEGLVGWYERFGWRRTAPMMPVAGYAEMGYRG